MEKTIYIRLRHRVQVKPNDHVTIGDIAQVVTNADLARKIKKLIVHQVSTSDKNMVVIDGMKVIGEIQRWNSQIEIQTLGPAQTLVEIVYKKRRITTVYFIAVWFLLFIGAALTIMNFHEDVAMQNVHSRIYTMVTGKEVNKPLLLQIPYSFGLGLGMILFFNHIFRKRINEEPSPLEVEMFNYQQDLDNYMIMNENKESMKRLNDD